MRMTSNEKWFWTAVIFFNTFNLGVNFVQLDERNKANAAWTAPWETDIQWENVTVPMTTTLTTYIRHGGQWRADYVDSMIEARACLPAREGGAMAVTDEDVRARELARRFVSEYGFVARFPVRRTQ